MPAWPDAGAILALLARVRRRRTVAASLEGAAAGLVAAAAGILVTTDPRLLAGMAGAAALAGAVARARASRASTATLAAAVERRAPESRNLILTAAELLDAPDRVRPDLGARVCRDAARIAGSLDPAPLWPVRRAAWTLTAAAAAWILAIPLLLWPRTVPTVTIAPGDGSGPAGPAIVTLVAETTPPAYAARDAETLADPDEIHALAGSRLRLTITADAARVRLTSGTGSADAERDADGRFVANLTTDATGLLALEPAGPDGTAGPARLVSLVVAHDRAPRVRLVEPGRDLFLPDATARLPLAVEADDDLAMASLALTYTTVSGSGENFEFVAGDVPLTVTQTSRQSWTGAGSLDLSGLDLEPGDLVVYRGVAADHRPGAPPVESDAFVIEILAPGEAAAAGFAIDDQQDRYALSQRMVLLKTERLAARQAVLAAGAVVDEAQVIAAEQRQVRAEFIFMMGGELTEYGEDSDPFMLHEEDEAHGEADIAAGRLENDGRAELTRAVRAMSRAAALLVSADLDAAIVEERAALEALQRAFSRSRYILRTLSERESIDLARRLSGTRSGLARGGLPAPGQPADAGPDARRRLLADVLAAAAAGTPDASHLVALAQAALAIDPESDALRAVAGHLADAARAVQGGDAANARQHLDAAGTALNAAARATAPGVGSPTPAPRSRLLRGLQIDASRGGGGVR